MQKHTLIDRLRYMFDNTMSKGTGALISWLFFLSTLLVVVGAIVVSFVAAPSNPDGSRIDFLKLVWVTLMHTLDAGTVAGDDGNWFFLITMLAISIGGIFVVSTLIGILSSGIEAKLEELRKGRSVVIEQNHTVVLGWSQEIFVILEQLIIANANQRRACVVILANQDKVAMEDAIRDRIGNTKSTKIVCRTGNPVDLDDLAIVNLHDARAIIVLSTEHTPSDSRVIKALLAIIKNPNRRPQPYHMVASIHHAQNIDIARTIGGTEAKIILATDLIARLTAQTCRQPGLSAVYTDLLTFEGNEIYFHHEPSMVGKTFAEIIFAYDTSTVIGVYQQDGTIMLAPPAQTQIHTGDRLIFIAEDDGDIVLSKTAPPPVDTSVFCTKKTNAPSPERTLILGWNNHAHMIIQQLDCYVAAGSEVMVVTDVAAAEEDILAMTCTNQRITFRSGDTSSRTLLESLSATTYDHVIVLSSDQHEPQYADEQTLMTLLYLREIADQHHHTFSIVSEMQDSHNRTLAQITRADDFIVSSQLVSFLLVQIAENKKLFEVFETLFSPESVEIYLKPVTHYLQTGQEVDFYTVTEAAQHNGEVAIGYRLEALSDDATRQYGIVLNPKKSARVTFSAGDSLIVLAEN